MKVSELIEWLKRLDPDHEINSEAKIGSLRTKEDKQIELRDDDPENTIW